MDYPISQVTPIRDQVAQKNEKKELTYYGSLSETPTPNQAKHSNACWQHIAQYQFDLLHHLGWGYLSNRRWLFWRIRFYNREAFICAFWLLYELIFRETSILFRSLWRKINGGAQHLLLSCCMLTSEGPWRKNQRLFRKIPIDMYKWIDFNSKIDN